MVTERPDNPEEIFARTLPFLLRSVSHAMHVFGYRCQIQSVHLKSSKHRNPLLWEESKSCERDVGIALALFAKKAVAGLEGDVTEPQIPFKWGKKKSPKQLKEMLHP